MLLINFSVFPLSVYIMFAYKKIWAYTCGFVFVASLVLSPLHTFAQDAQFSDVPQSHENYPAVKLLNELGIIKGYEDGTFRPGQPINRVESLKILLEGAEVAVAETVSNSEFGDVDTGAWFARYVEGAKKLGIVKGNPDGTFAPGRQVNKVEFIKMMLLTYKIDVSEYEKQTSLPFQDTPEGQWYLPYLRYSKKFNIISPDVAGNVNPGEQLTRGAAAEILYRLLLIKRGGGVQQLLSESEALLVDALLDIQLQKYNAAQVKIIEAVSKTKEATAQSDEAIVMSAYLVAQSIEQTIKGYLYLQEGNTEEAKNASNEAIRLAGEAEAQSNKVLPITNQVRGFSNNIIQAASN